MCEMCFENIADDWFLVDENAEMELCRTCARDLRKECNVEVMTQDG